MADFGDEQFQGAGSGPAEGFTDFAAPAAPAPATTENGSAGLEDFFGGSGAIQSAGGSAALPPVTSLGATGVVADIDEEGVVTEVAADPAPASDPDAPAPAAEDSDPFFTHWEHQQPAEPAAPAAPEPVDPRVEWRKQNAEVLKKKDADESAAKQKLKDSAAAHLKKFYEVRTTTLSTRKSNNRKSEAHQKAVEVPTSGTAWEKVNALVNFNSTAHQKDVARYKAVLITCKAKNVAIKA